MAYRPISADARSPLALYELEPAALEQLIAPSDARCAVRDFWRAARLDAAKASSSGPLLLRQQNVGAHAFGVRLGEIRKILRGPPQLRRPAACGCASHPTMAASGRLPASKRSANLARCRLGSTAFPGLDSAQPVETGPWHLTGYLVRAELLRILL